MDHHIHKRTFPHKHFNNNGKFYKKPFHPKFYKNPGQFGGVKRIFTNKPYNQHQRQVNFHNNFHNQLSQNLRRRPKFKFQYGGQGQAPYNISRGGGGGGQKSEYGFYRKQFHFPNEYKKHYIYQSQRMTFKMQTRNTIWKQKFCNNPFRGQRDFKWKRQFRRQFFGKRIILQSTPDPQSPEEQNENMERRTVKKLGDLQYTSTQPSISFQYVVQQENTSDMYMETYEKTPYSSTQSQSISGYSTPVPYWDSFPDEIDTSGENEDLERISPTPFDENSS